MTRDEHLLYKYSVAKLAHEYFTCMYVSICTVCVSAAHGEQTKT